MVCCKLLLSECIRIKIAGLIFYLFIIFNDANLNPNRFSVVFFSSIVFGLNEPKRKRPMIFAQSMHLYGET